MSESRRSEDQITVHLEGELKRMVEWLSAELHADPGQIVARAIGTLYMLLTEHKSGRRILTEDPYGYRRRINIMRWGDESRRRSAE